MDYGVKQYNYNGDGLRITKSGRITYDDFVWDVGAGLPLLLEDGAASYLYGPGGLLLEQVSANSDVYYYHADQLGSVRALTDAHGNVQNSYSYDAYGNVTASSVKVGNPFGFAGEYTDAESGLIYLRARYYDPATQQFLTRDPLAGLTSQPYSYAGSSPISLADPQGLFAICKCIGAYGLIGQLGGAVSICACFTSSGESGLLLNVGGTGAPMNAIGVGLTEGYAISLAANKISDLEGPFGGAGGSIGHLPSLPKSIPLGGSVDSVGGFNTCGQYIDEETANATLGFGPYGEFHAEGSDTIKLITNTDIANSLVAMWKGINRLWNEQAETTKYQLYPGYYPGIR